MNEANPYKATRRGGVPTPRTTGSLADVLERVLDKGIVIAGDIRVDLLDIELLTIRIRLLISSADKAQELGMAWWRDDPFYTGEVADAGDEEPVGDGVLQQLVEGTEELTRRVARLESGNGARSGEAAERRQDSTDDAG